MSDVPVNPDVVTVKKSTPAIVVGCGGGGGKLATHVLDATAQEPVVQVPFDALQVTDRVKFLVPACPVGQDVSLPVACG